MNRVVAIVQARMGASRLPNKMMLDLHGHPIIEWVRQRVRGAERLDHMLFALPDTPADDVLALYLNRLGVDVFRGSENDVLGRFHGAARYADAGRIVRICADNPLISASEIDRLVRFFQQGEFDYAYNHIPRNNRYPDGLGAEICGIDVLERLHKQAWKPAQREHVFNHVWDNPEQFSIGTFDPPSGLQHPELRLDLDTPSDYQALMTKPYRIDMSAAEVVRTALQE